MTKLQTAIFDLESDGLLDRLTTIHVLSITEYETGNKETYRGRSVAEGIQRLMDAEEIVGHNILGFDIPAIQKVYPWFEPTGQVTDTLVCSRLMFSHIKEGDFELFREKKLPGNLIGSHGLEGWGHRLGMHKGDYKKDKEREAKELGIIDPEEIFLHVWGSWNQEMEDYCENDVALTVILYVQILEEDYPQYPVDLEHEVADLMIYQEANGFPCNKAKLNKLTEKMNGISFQIEEECKRQFKGRYKAAKYIDGNGATTLPKRTLNYKSTARSSLTDGAEYSKIVWKDFNPGSRDMVAERLKEMNWIPTEFTETGKPSLNDEVLKEAARTIPIAGHLADFFMVRKRLGQIASGKENWIDHITDEGKIHGYVNPCGAVTGRATHSFPNLGQVPSINYSDEDENGKSHILMGKEGGWGFECRDSFHAPEPFKLMGADLSGIELRCLAHYMHKYDDGEYGRQLLEGDIHTVNQHAAGLPTRDDAKTFIYACCPLNTEAQTKDGWKTYEQLNVGELIQTYNSITKQMEWKPILEKVYYEDAELIEMNNNTGFNIVSTPNHRWFTKNDILTTEQLTWHDEILTTIYYDGSHGYTSCDTIGFNKVPNASVWCVRTENESWVIRQGDCITITGNTLYGAGGEKIGSIVAPGKSAEKQKRMGYKLKRRFLKNTPALRDLMDEIERDVERDGYLIGLDGRRLHIRHKHAALNTLLQSAGALVAKKWITLFEKFMIEDGFVHSWDGDFAMMAWIHDEIQVAVLPEHAEAAGKIAEESALAAGEFFEFTIPTAAEYKIGNTWAETH